MLLVVQIAILILSHLPVFPGYFCTKLPLELLRPSLVYFIPEFYFEKYNIPIPIVHTLFLIFGHDFNFEFKSNSRTFNFQR